MTIVINEWNLNCWRLLQVRNTLINSRKSQGKAPIIRERGNERHTTGFKGVLDIQGTADPWHSLEEENVLKTRPGRCECFITAHTAS